MRKSHPLKGIVSLMRDITPRKRSEESFQESEKKYRMVIESMDDIIFVFDKDDRFYQYYCSDHTKLFLTPERFLTKHIEEVMPHPVAEKYHAAAKKVRETGENEKYEYSLEIGNEEQWFSASLDLQEDGESIVAVIRDITGLKRAENELRRSEALQRTLAAALTDFVFVLDSSGIIRSANRLQPGHRQEDVIGQRAAEFVAPKYRDAFEEVFRQAVDTGRIQSVETSVDLPDGKHFFLCRLNPVHLDGMESSVVLIATDITDRKLIEDRILHLANHDELTNLPSLRLAKDRIYMALKMARRYKTLIAVMFVDVDGLKSINDSYGHEAGDILLVEVSKRLLSCVRDTDTVARIGGDEFLIVVTALRYPENAALIAENVIQTVFQPITLDGNQVNVGISVGIAIYPDDGDDAESLIKRADKAMYAVKNSGKKGYAFASEEK